jgi:hypothetical protein
MAGYFRCGAFKSAEVGDYPAPLMAAIPEAA